MEFFDSTKSIAENLSLISNPILAMFAVVGVVQIFQAKKALVINSKRDAANLATQQIKDYNERIIPVLTKYDFALIEDKVSAIKIEVGEFSEAYLIEKLGNKLVLDKYKESIKYVVLLCDALNALEAFSTYFTKGVADEQIAYSAVGRTFCYSVENYFFEISSCRNENDPTYQNIIELYHIWKPRLDKDRLIREQETILKKMSNINSTIVNPIGTK
jgi:hypothetical protein